MDLTFITAKVLTVIFFSFPFETMVHVPFRAVPLPEKLVTRLPPKLVLAVSILTPGGKVMLFNTLSLAGGSGVLFLSISIKMV